MNVHLDVALSNNFEPNYISEESIKTQQKDKIHLNFLHTHNLCLVINTLPANIILEKTKLNDFITNC